jgi:Domain of Unknown Function (DUF1206)
MKATPGVLLSARERQTVLKAMARLGFGARGLLYLLVGGFAVAAVLGSGGQPHGITDGLRAIANTPLRLAAVATLTVGLGCFAGYLTMVGLSDWVHGRGARHWAAGAGMLGDAVIYLGVAASVIGTALGSHSGEQQTHALTAWALGQPFGRVLVGVVGAVVCGGACCFVLWALTAHIGAKVALSHYQKRLLAPVGRYGEAGRGLAIALVGSYWIVAAINADPSKAHQLGGALHSLRQSPYGEVLLLLLGVAFIASALFDLVEAVFHRSGFGARVSRRRR